MSSFTRADFRASSSDWPWANKSSAAISTAEVISSSLEWGLQVACVPMKLTGLANQLGCQLIGDGDVEITGVAGMEQAGPTELTFLANPKYAPQAKYSRAAAICVP